MATQTESTARPNKSRANSHSDNAAAQPEINSTALVKVTRQFVETLTDDQRHELIAVAAYHLAEGRNFEPGREAEDWLAAESLVQSLSAKLS
jgi:Protein of unknown function (DUF2934)